MEPQTAAYYRAILFNDDSNLTPLPETLVKVHYWAVKKHTVLGLGSMLPKQLALTIVMIWMGSTKEGREFSRENTPLGDVFTVEDDAFQGDSDDDIVISSEEWDSLPEESPVVVIMKNKTTRDGQFIQRRGSWIDVRIDGDVKPFRIGKVRIPAGV